jgi:hypothetical protein
LFALAAAIIALGAVYWLVRDQDRSEWRERHAAEGNPEPIRAQTTASLMRPTGG